MSVRDLNYVQLRYIPQSSGCTYVGRLPVGKVIICCTGMYLLAFRGETKMNGGWFGRSLSVDNKSIPNLQTDRQTDRQYTTIPIRK